jgi:hypothetical protein
MARQADEAEFRRIASSHGDAGKTAGSLEGRTVPEPFALNQSRLLRIAAESPSPLTKAELSNPGSKISAREGQYVVKI